MIIVTGQARSGTTLMWRLLRAAGFDLGYEPLRDGKLWPPTGDGAKQPWRPGLEIPDGARVIRMSRPMLDAAYARWEREPGKKVSPDECVERWKADELEMDERIPDAKRIAYLRLCRWPTTTLQEVLIYLGVEELSRRATDALLGWSSVEVPSWAEAGYRTDQIHPPRTGAWRSEPLFLDVARRYGVWG